MTPTTEAELSEAIRQAEGPLCIRGGGTRTKGQIAPGAVLSTGGLRGITLYEPGALTLVAQAGTELTEIAAALAAENQRLPFEPPDLRGLLGTEGASTIGGVAAANASGPRRIQAGACRDSMLGVRFVDGAGTIIKNGGRVMKNVTGYDLVKLLAGSRGTLGVITEVSLKVLPVPETEATLTLHGLDDATAIRAMSAALGSPYEVTGAAHGPIAEGVAPATRLRIEGFDGSVRYRARELAAMLAPFGPVETSPDRDASATLWRGVRDVAPFNGRAYVARLSIKPSDLPALLAALSGAVGAVPPQRAGVEVLLDWGGGLVWVAADTQALERSARSAPDGDAVLRGAELLHRFLQAHCTAHGGHATLFRGPAGLSARVPTLQPEPAPLAALTAALRARFDPRGILNRDAE